MPAGRGGKTAAPRFSLQGLLFPIWKGETEVDNPRPIAIRWGYLSEAHMQADRVDATIGYPTVGLLLFGVPDSELLTETFRAYNDWLLTPILIDVRG